MKTVLITNDWQIPFHDVQVIEGLFMPFLKWLRPDEFIWNGDIIDNYNLSEFSKNPLQKPTLIDEATVAREYMARISKTKGLQRKVWLGGNHEDRLRRYMWQHAGRLQLGPDDTFESVFAPKAHGFDYLPYGSVVALGSLDVTHGSIVRQHSGWSAKAHFDKRGGSVIIGHTHRLGTYYRTNAKGVHVSIENGCLCSLKPEYVQDPDWQQGWAVVKVADDGNFNVQQIPVINREAIMYGEKTWTL
jgi:UDP-2,3-diacylglucosamine pyrophosphatase LpxH